LNACPAPELASEAAALLDEHEQIIRSQNIDSPRAEEHAVGSALLWTDQQRQAVHGLRREARITKKTTVDEQLNEKPDHESPASDGEQGKQQD
jgi:hypothetical protein